MEVRAVQAADGLLRCGVSGHLDETEPTRSRGLPVRDDLRAGDLTVGGEGVSQVVVARG